jgi:hypothetical protein
MNGIKTVERGFVTTVLILKGLLEPDNPESRLSEGRWFAAVLLGLGALGRLGLGRR